MINIFSLIFDEGISINGVGTVDRKPTINSGVVNRSVVVNGTVTEKVILIVDGVGLWLVDDEVVDEEDATVDTEILLAIDAVDAVVTVLANYHFIVD
ncbi:hypothetical protein NDU88_003798 [Pleurodeles waltl]|uniref:Uncharacterized protein n=1 Tax=Pleurodeles waltl TaxID=8319 RepID=A0AAV7L2U2_PLEWA|nr:hypothetical protein NDU88_003798 [Pleurodeles waltl]